jgi:TRAP-type C4-dicarboxylate transport system permease small subunit
MNFFDLRLPLGWLFTILGGLLIIAGLRATPATDASSLGINMNLIWGAVMIVFGLICLWLARSYARKRRRADESTRTDLPKH